MKNGAELLDRLVKDIVSESAATYVSLLQSPYQAVSSPDSSKSSERLEPDSAESSTAFSLAKFIPLLRERIYVINPFTRHFLVSWVTLLDTIPDLELVSYLPAFLGGLFRFLSDSNRDVHVATQGALGRFLSEIQRIAKVKRELAESRNENHNERAKGSDLSDNGSLHSDRSVARADSEVIEGDSGGEQDEKSGQGDGDWVPGQDVKVDHSKILEILVAFLDPSSGMASLRVAAEKADIRRRGRNTAHSSSLDRYLL